MPVEVKAKGFTSYVEVVSPSWEESLSNGGVATLQVTPSGEWKDENYNGNHPPEGTNGCASSRDESVSCLFDDYGKVVGGLETYSEEGFGDVQVVRIQLSTPLKLESDAPLKLELDTPLRLEDGTSATLDTGYFSQVESVVSLDGSYRETSATSELCADDAVKQEPAASSKRGGDPPLKSELDETVKPQKDVPSGHEIGTPLEQAISVPLELESASSSSDGFFDSLKNSPIGRFFSRNQQKGEADVLMTDDSQSEVSENATGNDDDYALSVTVRSLAGEASFDTFSFQSELPDIVTMQATHQEASVRQELWLSDDKLYVRDIRRSFVWNDQTDGPPVDTCSPAREVSELHVVLGDGDGGSSKLGDEWVSDHGGCTDGLNHSQKSMTDCRLMEVVNLDSVLLPASEQGFGGVIEELQKRNGSGLAIINEEELEAEQPEKSEMTDAASFPEEKGRGLGKWESVDGQSTAIWYSVRVDGHRESLTSDGWIHVTESDMVEETTSSQIDIDHGKEFEADDCSSDSRSGHLPNVAICKEAPHEKAGVNQRTEKLNGDSWPYSERRPSRLFRSVAFDDGCVGPFSGGAVKDCDDDDTQQPVCSDLEKEQIQRDSSKMTKLLNILRRRRDVDADQRQRQEVCTDGSQESRNGKVLDDPAIIRIEKSFEEVSLNSTISQDSLELDIEPEGVQVHEESVSVEAFNTVTDVCWKEEVDVSDESMERKSGFILGIPPVSNGKEALSQIVPKCSEQSFIADGEMFPRGNPKDFDDRSKTGDIWEELFLTSEGPDFTDWFPSYREEQEGKDDRRSDRSWAREGLRLLTHKSRKNEDESRYTSCRDGPAMFPGDDDERYVSLDGCAGMSNNSDVSSGMKYGRFGASPELKQSLLSRLKSREWMMGSKGGDEGNDQDHSKHLDLKTRIPRRESSHGGDAIEAKGQCFIPDRKLLRSRTSLVRGELHRQNGGRVVDHPGFLYLVQQRISARRSRKVKSEVQRKTEGDRDEFLSYSATELGEQSDDLLIEVTVVHDGVRPLFSPRRVASAIRDYAMSDADIARQSNDAEGYLIIDGGDASLEVEVQEDFSVQKVGPEDDGSPKRQAVDLEEIADILNEGLDDYDEQTQDNGVGQEDDYLEVVAEDEIAMVKVGDVEASATIQWPESHEEERAEDDLVRGGIPAADTDDDDEQEGGAPQEEEPVLIEVTSPEEASPEEEEDNGGALINVEISAEDELVVVQDEPEIDDTPVIIDDVPGVEDAPEIVRDIQEVDDDTLVIEDKPYFEAEQVTVEVNGNGIHEEEEERGVSATMADNVAINVSLGGEREEEERREEPTEDTTEEKAPPVKKPHGSLSLSERIRAFEMKQKENEPIHRDRGQSHKLGDTKFTKYQKSTDEPNEDEPVHKPKAGSKRLDMSRFSVFQKPGDSPDGAPKKNFTIKPVNKSPSRFGNQGISSTDSSNKCLMCDKRVYPMDKISADGKSFHKACFRCNECKKVLNLGNYAALNSVIFCKPHFTQRFKLHGNYDTGFSKGTSLRSPNTSSDGNFGFDGDRSVAMEEIAATEAQTTESTPVLMEQEGLVRSSDAVEEQMTAEGGTKSILEQFKKGGVSNVEIRRTIDSEKVTVRSLEEFQPPPKDSDEVDTHVKPQDMIATEQDQGQTAESEPQRPREGVVRGETFEEMPRAGEGLKNLKSMWEKGGISNAETRVEREKIEVRSLEDVDHSKASAVAENIPKERPSDVLAGDVQEEDPGISSGLARRIKAQFEQGPVHNIEEKPRPELERPPGSLEDYREGDLSQSVSESTPQRREDVVRSDIPLEEQAHASEGTKSLLSRWEKGEVEHAEEKPKGGPEDPKSFKGEYAESSPQVRVDLARESDQPDEAIPEGLAKNISQTIEGGAISGEGEAEFHLEVGVRESEPKRLPDERGDDQGVEFNVEVNGNVSPTENGHGDQITPNGHYQNDDEGAVLDPSAEIKAARAAAVDQDEDQDQSAILVESR